MFQQISKLSHPDSLGKRRYMIDFLRIQPSNPQLLIPRGRMDQCVEHTGNGGFSPGNLPTMGCSPEFSVLKNFPVFFVKPGLGQNFLFFHRNQVFQIQFIAQAAEISHVGPGGQRCGPEGLGMRRCGNMRTEGRLGIEITQIPLNGEPFNGIRIITAPDLGRKAQHTQIKPVAAGRTAFQQDPGPGFKNPAQHIIKSQNIVMGPGAQGN